MAHFTTPADPMFCVGTDTRCQHANTGECEKLIRWGVTCRWSKSGKLDEELPTTTCSPLCKLDLGWEGDRQPRPTATLRALSHNLPF